MSDTSDQILDAAEAMIREGGYHAFSFREIANELAIKSASVHYHFPTKEALGSAVATRYMARFIEALGAPESHPDSLRHYVTVFQQALEKDGRACLCGILAAETGRLPESLCVILREFNVQNIAWLIRGLKTQHSDWSDNRLQETATVIFSALEGAMTFAALNKQNDHLRSVGNSLLRLCS